MKYKVGDKVRVREDLIAEELYGKDVFVSEMTSFKGQTVTIKKIQDNKYLIEEDLEDWYWTEEMFLSVTKYNIGDKVIVKDDLIEYEKYKDVSFVPSMNPFKGKIVTIYDISDRGYRIEEDSHRWRWTDDMFSRKIPEDFGSEESDLKDIIPEGENSSDIIFTIKPIKVKLLLL